MGTVSRSPTMLKLVTDMQMLVSRMPASTDMKNSRSRSVALKKNRCRISAACLTAARIAASVLPGEKAVATDVMTLPTRAAVTGSVPSSSSWMRGCSARSSSRRSTC